MGFLCSSKTGDLYPSALPTILLRVTGGGGGSYSANEKRTGVVEGEDKSVLVVGLESDLDFAALLLEEPRWVSDRLVQASSS